MAEKICCPGPLGTSGGNTASGGAFREAVCVHTSKVYDSCRSKECLRDIRVYLTRDAQDMLDSGGIVSVKPRTPALQSYTQKNHRLSAVVFPFSPEHWQTLQRARLSQSRRATGTAPLRAAGAFP